jgi:hypothetical protein
MDLCQYCRSWLFQFPASASLITRKGSVIFCALALYDAIKKIVHFDADDGDVWTPQLLTALIIFICTACAAPFLLQLNRGTGTLMLELLGEMEGWSCVGVFEHTIVGNGSNEDKLYAALQFLGILVLVAPIYLIFGRLLRAKAHALPRLQRKMSELDNDVVAYFIGFTLQVFFGRTVNLIGWSIGATLFFFIELSIATKIVIAIERLRSSTPSTTTISSGATRVAAEVTEHALGVSLGFAYLLQFKSVWADFVYGSVGEDYDADDATWLEVGDEADQGEEGGELTSHQGWLGVLWLAFMLIVIVMVHALSVTKSELLANLSSSKEPESVQQKRDARKARRRLAQACLALAFGFATEKATGTLFVALIKSEGLEVWVSAAIALLVMWGLGVRHAAAYDKRHERRSEHASAAMESGPYGSAQNVLKDDESKSGSDNDSDSEDEAETHDSFEVVNSMVGVSEARTTTNSEMLQEPLAPTAPPPS